MEDEAGKIVLGGREGKEYLRRTEIRGGKRRRVKKANYIRKRMV